MSQHVDERELYEPVKEALESFFLDVSRKGHFEVASSKGPSNEMKGHLPVFSVFLWNVEKFKPDIMGYFLGDIVLASNGSKWTPINVVIAEVKPRTLRFSDIYQVKGYAEIYNAAYAILVSPYETSNEMRRILEMRPQLLNTSALAGGRILMAKIALNEGRFVEWYPSDVTI